MLAAGIVLVLPAVVDVGGAGRAAGATSTQDLLYVTGGNTVIEYTLDATGAATPVATLAGPRTGLDGPAEVVVDSSGTVYVANLGYDTASNSPPSITVYAPGAAGDAQPIRTIQGPATFLGGGGVAVSSDGTIFALGRFDGAPAVTEYPPGATGDAAPLRTITGPATDLGYTGGDSSHLPSDLAATPDGHLFALGTVDDAPAIVEFAPDATGDVPPSRYLGGAAVGDVSSGIGIAVDAAGDLAVTATDKAPPGSGPAVEIFAPSASGDATPTRTIYLPGTRHQALVWGLAWDPDGGLHVSNGDVLGYSPLASGNATPATDLPSNENPDLVFPWMNLAVGPAGPPPGPPTWTLGADSSVYLHGSAPNAGLLGGYDAPAVGMTSDETGHGYWITDSHGDVSYDRLTPNYGDASSYPLAAPIVGIASTPDGRGYWLVAADGGVFSYGDANFYGSMGGVHLNQPIVGMTADPATGGYWLVAADGGVFSFNAPFEGSEGGKPLDQPVVGMARTASGHGYWLTAADGGVFSFGDATFEGSAASFHLAAPVVGIAPTATGRGYWMAAADGGIFAFGDAPFEGSEGGVALPSPIVSIARG